MAKTKSAPKVKRKGGGVQAKVKQVEELSAYIAGSPAIVVTEYRGLKVQELQDLRRKLRPRGVEYHVVKNTLFVRAAEKAGQAAARHLFTGPSAVAVPAQGTTLDEVDLAKSLVDEMRTFKALKIVGALLDGKALSGDDVQSIARLPGRPQLQAMIVGSLQAPLGNVAGVLGAPLAQLIRVLNARGAAA